MYASIARCHDLHVLLRHRYSRSSASRFGGCAGLVDLGGRKASDRAACKKVDPSLALSNVTVATNQTPVLDHDRKHNSTAEVT